LAALDFRTFPAAGGRRAGFEAIKSWTFEPAQACGAFGGSD
jgi:hypothetical protein